MYFYKTDKTNSMLEPAYFFYSNFFTCLIIDNSCWYIFLGRRLCCSSCLLHLSDDLIKPRRSMVLRWRPKQFRACLAILPDSFKSCWPPFLIFPQSKRIFGLERGMKKTIIGRLAQLQSLRTFFSFCLPGHVGQVSREKEFY